MHMKTCNACLSELDNNMFYKDRCQPDGYKHKCKKCYGEYRKNLESKSEKARDGVLRRNKINRVAKRFKISTCEYDSYFTDANGCGICGNTDKKMVLDHCHTTGKVRGVLCENCNFAIGHLNDDIELLNKAILWLRK